MINVKNVEIKEYRQSRQCAGISQIYSDIFYPPVCYKVPTLKNNGSNEVCLSFYVEGYIYVINSSVYPSQPHTLQDIFQGVMPHQRVDRGLVTLVTQVSILHVLLTGCIDKDCFRRKSLLFVRKPIFNLATRLSTIPVCLPPVIWGKKIMGLVA